MNNIFPIKTQKDYQEALKKVEKLWDNNLSVQIKNNLEVLTVLIENYEEKQYKILPPDPIEAIKFRMEQMNLTTKDLGEIIGANRTSEILNGQRGLSLNLIRTLSRELKIPAGLLIGSEAAD